MRLRGPVATVATVAVAAATLVGAVTAVMRAWSASPYHAVNVYFSGTQRFDTTQTQLGSDPTWTATLLSNGWSLIPTVVDLQAPCYGGKKQKMSSNAAT